MSSSSLDDATLIDRVQHGDRDAFNALIDRHSQKAFQFAYKLTREPEMAADVVSDAFIRIYNAMPNFKGQSSFSTWMYRILTNCFLDQKKKEKNKQTVSLDSSSKTEESNLAWQVESNDPRPDEDLERTEREEAIQIALSKLPEYQRVMMVMFHTEMLSYEEIADALNTPIGTVKSRLNRARLQLRELLQEHQELFFPK